MPSIPAYEAYLKYRFHQWRFTPEDSQRSRECLEQALSLDPGFALPYVGLADYHLALAAVGAMPSLEAPTLHPTAPAMGELPTTVEPSKAGWTRWAIPLTLAAVVAAAAVYEWKRPVASIRPAQAKEAVAPSVPATDSVPPDKTEAPLANPAAGTAPVTAPTFPEAATASAPAPADSKGAGRAP